MKRSYIQLSRAHYSELMRHWKRQITDRIDIVIETDEGNMEAAIEWRVIGNAVLPGSQVCPQFTAFDDAWAMFALLPDLFQELSVRQNTNPTPQEIAGLLEELHFEDATPTEAKA